MDMRSSAAARRHDMDGGDPTSEMTEDPVLRSVRTAPVRPGRPLEWEAEVLREAAAEPWFDGASVSAEIAARAQRGR